jgi:hypothetical protein
MTPAAAMTRYCGGRTRSGTKCKRPAGWGTDHLGRGRCKLHGGSTPSHRKAAAAEEALEFARGALGSELDVGPLDALLLAVRLAAGSVAYYRLKLQAVPEGTDVPATLVEGYERSLDRLTRSSKAAVDGGVAERQVRIAERVAERISLAAEEAMAELELAPAQRSRFAEAFGRALTRLEDTPLEGTATEVLRQ